MHCLFQKILPAIHFPHQGHVLMGAVTLHQVVASDHDTSFDDLRTISSDDYIPRCDPDSSDNREDCERHFHQEERLEVHRHRRLAAREYEHFAV